VVVVLVVTVIVEVAEAVPIMLTFAGANEQEGMPVAPAGIAVTAHVSAIEPVKPFDGLAAIVDRPEVAGRVIATAVPDSV
jgi:hypothetical protein